MERGWRGLRVLGERWRRGLKYESFVTYNLIKNIPYMKMIERVKRG